jgi:CHAT domain-containing protein
MEEFYRRLWGGKKVSKLEALRQAQLHVLRNPDLVRKRRQEVREKLLAKRVPEADLASRGLGRVAQAGAGLAERSPVALWGAWTLAGDAD